MERHPCATPVASPSAGPFPTPTRSRRAFPSALATLLMLVATALTPRATLAASRHAALDQDAEARHLADVYWARHVPHGAAPTQATVVTATFQVLNTAFNLDGNVFTTDTAKVLVGETVAWVYVNGIHTTTNGEDAFDPSAGALWDSPIDSFNRRFEYTFTDAGFYPFFCQVHGTLMKGYVLVSAATGVEPAPGEAGRIGFASPPAPNPSPGRVSFRIGLARAGRVQLRVVDAQGRLVAKPIDEDFSAGTYAAAWDGRTRTGQLAKAGVYYLSLSVPGARQTRRVTLER